MMRRAGVVTVLALAAAACGALRDGNDEFSCPYLRKELVEIEQEAALVEAAPVLNDKRVQELTDLRETVQLDLGANGCR